MCSWRRKYQPVKTPSPSAADRVVTKLASPVESAESLRNSPLGLEIEAMLTIGAVLDVLDAEAVQRVLAWADSWAVAKRGEV